MSQIHQEALKRITKARIALVTSQPFFGVLALQMDAIEEYGIPTMATNGIRLLYNPDFVMKLTEPELIGVWVHEIFHCVFLHHVRRGERDPILWNLACDWAINPEILACGFTLPKGGLNDPKYRGMGAEAIYALLPPAQYMSGGGSGSDPGGCGQIMDAAPSHDKAGLEKARIATETQLRQAVMIAKASGEGRLPASIARVIRELDKGRITWKEILRRFADESIIRDYTWSRPNRRFVGSGLILPGMVTIAPNHIALVWDTSGSMHEPSLKVLGSESQSILDEEAAERLTIISCDASVNKVDTYTAGDIIDLNPVGGGGTDFAPAFRYIADNLPDVTGILYMTDLQCSSWGVAPHVPVLWCVTGGRARDVPFGDVIEIDPHS